MTLIGFLLACIAEDEAAALEATPGPWVQGGTHWRDEETGEPRVMHAHVAAKGAETIMVADMNTHPIIGRRTTPPRYEGNSAHIARHDPARVLADVAAKRAIMELHEIVPVDDGSANPHPFGCVVCDEDRDYGVLGNGWCPTLRHLASPFADHPDYREEWRP